MPFQRPPLSALLFQQHCFSFCPNQLYPHQVVLHPHDLSPIPFLSLGGGRGHLFAMYLRFLTSFLSRPHPSHFCCTECLFSCQQIWMETKEDFFFPSKYTTEEILYQNPWCLCTQGSRRQIRDQGDATSCKHKWSNISLDSSWTRIFISQSSRYQSKPLETPRPYLTSIFLADA